MLLLNAGGFIKCGDGDEEEVEEEPDCMIIEEDEDVFELFEMIGGGDGVCVDCCWFLWCFSCCCRVAHSIVDLSVS